MRGGHPLVRTLGLLAATALAPALLATWAAPGAVAQTADETTTTPPTAPPTSAPDTTTTAVPSPATTLTTLDPASLPSRQPTVTTAPPGKGSAATTAPTTTTVPPGDADGPTPPGPHVVPPGAQAVIDSVKRSPPNSTAALVAALHPLVALGLTEQQADVMGMGRFPVGGLANFSDDWLMARFDGGFHFHHGCDVFAAGGTPVRAPTDGVLRQSSDTLGGITDYVTQPDGTYFYMAHLSAYTPGQVSGQAVKTGDVIGFVGNSGDAVGGATHVHFEIHPKGGGPIDPKPYLDQWVADAVAAAPALVAARQGLMSTPDGAAVVIPPTNLPNGTINEGFVADPQAGSPIDAARTGQRPSDSWAPMAVIAFLLLGLLVATLFDELGLGLRQGRPAPG